MSKESMDALFVVDAEHESSADTFKQCADKMQLAWNAFLDISEKMLEDSKVLEGNRAYAYSQFVALAKEVVAQRMLSYVGNISVYEKGYIGAVDEADDVLYTE
jgi:hypothetical protein